MYYEQFTKENKINNHNSWIYSRLFQSELKVRINRWLSV